MAQANYLPSSSVKNDFYRYQEAFNSNGWDYYDFTKQNYIDRSELIEFCDISPVPRGLTYNAINVGRLKYTKHSCDAKEFTPIPVGMSSRIGKLEKLDLSIEDSAQCLKSRGINSIPEFQAFVNILIKEAVDEALFSIESTIFDSIDATINGITPAMDKVGVIDATKGFDHLAVQKINRFIGEQGLSSSSTELLLVIPIGASDQWAYNAGGCTGMPYDVSVKNKFVREIRGRIVYSPAYSSLFRREDYTPSGGTKLKAVVGYLIQRNAIKLSYGVEDTFFNGFDIMKNVSPGQEQAQLNQILNVKMHNLNYPRFSGFSLTSEMYIGAMRQKDRGIAKIMLNPDII